MPVQSSHPYESPIVSIMTSKMPIEGPRKSGSLASRRPTLGPENDLVMAFVSTCLPEPPAGQLLKVFHEPAIESGFPDVVAVYADISTMERWLPSRPALTREDVRVAHFVATAGDCNSERINQFFGRSGKTAVNRLTKAGFLLQSGDQWEMVPVDQIFAVRRLIAIEAKINAWKEGLEQAFKNTWFASESYLLLPKLPKRLSVMEETRRLGVGMAVLGTKLDSSVVASKQDNIPKSYASWLFNEWVWRAVNDP